MYNYVGLRQNSHLVPRHSTQGSLGINVSTFLAFLQGPTLEFGHCAGARVQSRDLIIGRKSGHGVPVAHHFG